VAGDRFERPKRQDFSATSNDRDADPLQVMPTLIKTAPTRFPFDAPADWPVKLRMDEARGMPHVVSATPLQK
jgi:hypothetical protein